MRRQKKIKKLIVNADDFGLDSAVNSGIIQAHESGIVRSASLMSCGAEFKEAVQLVKEHPGLGVGVHLSLHEGFPVADRSKIASLLNKDKTGFPEFNKFSFFRINLAQVSLEFEAQISKFIDAGLRPTHLDGHKHIHMFPGIFNIVLKLAGKFKIPGMRLSREPFLANLFSGKCPWVNQYWFLSRIADLNWLLRARKYPVKFPEYCCGLTQSCCLNQASLGRILRSLPFGSNELICHPGVGKQNQEEELNVLKSREIKELVNDLGIQLIKYDQI